MENFLLSNEAETLRTNGCYKVVVDRKFELSRSCWVTKHKKKKKFIISIKEMYKRYNCDLDIFLFTYLFFLV